MAGTQAQAQNILNDATEGKVIKGMYWAGTRCLGTVDAT